MILLCPRVIGTLANVTLVGYIYVAIVVVKVVVLLRDALRAAPSVTPITLGDLALLDDRLADITPRHLSLTSLAFMMLVKSAKSDSAHGMRNDMHFRLKELHMLVQYLRFLLARDQKYLCLIEVGGQEGFFKPDY